MFIGKYNKSLIVTYIGVIFAILGMNFSLLGNLKYTMICMVIAGVCDLFDGKIARMCDRTEEKKRFERIWQILKTYKEDPTSSVPKEENQSQGIK